MPATGTAVVCTHEVSVSELRPGSIVVSCGRALYLQEDKGTLCGYRRWTYSRHMPDGQVIGRGTLEFREDGAVTVVCITLDGKLLTP